jgi:hypothetical protein
MARTARYITIAGMLAIVAWFFWNPEGWVFEWEPVVVFILTLAGFVTAEAAEVYSVSESAELKKDQSHPNDVLLAKQFLQSLPSDGGISFLKKHDFLGSFKSDDISDIDRFSYEWNNPDHEFIDSELESLRKKLLDSVTKFGFCTAMYTSPNKRGFQAVRYDQSSYDADEEKRFSVEASEINNAADLVVEAYSSFVRTVRSKLDLT